MTVDLPVVLATGLALGAAYALVGVAVSAVALATRTLHLAVGPVLVAGVLVRLLLGVDVTGVPEVVAVLAGLAAGALLSAALGPLLLDRLPPGLPWLVGLAVAGGVVEVGVARWLGTRTFRPEPVLLGHDTVTVLGADVGVPTLVAVALGVPGAAALALVLRHTRWGRRLRLVGGSEDAAVLLGVTPSRTRAGALAAGGAVAVLAGLLLAPVTFVGVGQGAVLTVRGVAAAALLGPGGPLWALPGGLALGLVESLAQSAWPNAGGEVAVALAVVVVLAVRGSEHTRAWGRAW